MTTGRIGRWSIALTIGFAVALVQAGAFAALFFQAWQDFTSPATVPLAYQVTNAAQVMRNELVIPICGHVLGQYWFQPQQVLRLQAIHLETGRVRNFEVSGAGILNGIVSNGERIWFFNGSNTNIVHEFDGTQVLALKTKGPPKNRFFPFAPFLYENSPALIEQDVNGKYRLFVLVGDTWQDKGQIALPGKGRAWAMDERAGESVMLPRTTANPITKEETWVRLWAASANGQLHLFQEEASYAGETDTLTYRNGIDFVAPSTDDEAVSALAPENAAADTTGWVQLDSQSGFYRRPVVSNEGILLTKGMEIWRQIRADVNKPSRGFERIAKVDEITWRQFDLVSSSDSGQVYVIARPLGDAMELYRLEDRQLLRVPIRIEGLWSRGLSWLVKHVFLAMAILSIGTVLLIVFAAPWTGTITYSFGHDSVVLASLVRRCLARSVDLFAIVGPLTIQTLVLFQFRFLGSILKLMVAWFESRSQFLILIPAVVWIGLAWIALVISTGIWGITPGKWLFGIRVVRSTLRPCGILRALLRELLLWVDMPHLLTAIPGVISMIVTEKRQRIGDLAADTLVTVAAKKGSVMTFTSNSDAKSSVRAAEYH